MCRRGASAFVTRGILFACLLSRRSFLHPRAMTALTASPWRHEEAAGCTQPQQVRARCLWSRNGYKWKLLKLNVLKYFNISIVPSVKTSLFKQNIYNRCLRKHNNWFISRCTLKSKHHWAFCWLWYIGVSVHLLSYQGMGISGNGEFIISVAGNLCEILLWRTVTKDFSPLFGQDWPLYICPVSSESYPLGIVGACRLRNFCWQSTGRLKCWILNTSLLWLRGTCQT